MADEEKKEGAAPEATEAKAGGKRKPLVLGAGFVVVLIAAYFAALMAVPSKHKERRFEGPFSLQLFNEKIHVNLAEEGKKRFLQMNFNVIFVAYEEAYVQHRVADPLYLPYVDDAVRRVSMLKTIDDLIGDKAATGIYLEEIREAIDPILFPVHVGNTEKPTAPDEASGIGPGLSIGKSTFRGPLDQHVLHVDGKARTVRLDDGPEVAFQGDEHDVEVRDAQDRTVYLDVSAFEEGFQGDLPIGVHGQVREILLKDLLIQ
jgi:hypothetical protein